MSEQTETVRDELFDETTLASMMDAALRTAETCDEPVANTIRRLVRHLRREVALRPIVIPASATAYQFDFGGTVSCGVRAVRADVCTACGVARVHHDKLPHPFAQLAL